jgi:predicted metal-dependent peptidase
MATIRAQGRVTACRDFLRRFGRSHAAQGLRGTLRRPNRRYGWEQPGLRVRGKATFAVIVDTSGSVGDAHLARFFAHLESWSQWADLVVIQVDGAVQSVAKHRRGAPSMQFHGRAGTVLDEAFDLVAGRVHRDIPNRHLVRDIAAVMILTDGELWSVPESNPMHVDALWVLTPGAKKKATWGQHVHLEDE